MILDSYYKTVLDIITDDPDWKAIVIKIAKEDPKLMCEALGIIPWEQTATALVKSQGLVAAIKYIRAETHMGLKEAKDHADEIKRQIIEKNANLECIKQNE